MNPIYGETIGPIELIWAKNSKEFVFSNSILIHGDQAVLVDPSAHFTHLEHLAAQRIVSTVVCTHYHGDHHSLSHLFSGVEFAAHRLDAPALRSFEHYHQTIDPDPTSPYSSWARALFQTLHITEVPVTRELEEGDVLLTGKEKIHVLHLPGHTPGHIGLFFERADLFFLADIDLTPYGPWYANIVSDINQFEASLQRVHDVHARHYVTSHGERIYDRHQYLERLGRFRDIIRRRDDDILELLGAGPKTLEALAAEPIVYRKVHLSDPLKHYFGRQMIAKHLDRLMREGGIMRDPSGAYHL